MYLIKIIGLVLLAVVAMLRWGIPVPLNYRQPCSYRAGVSYEGDYI